MLELWRSFQPRSPVFSAHLKWGQIDYCCCEEFRKTTVGLNSCRPGLALVEGYSEDIAIFLAMVPKLLYSRVLIELKISEKK